jgi:uncharacterized protein YceH (UPF0502 family)
MSLTDRIRQAAQDANEGDTTGTLRDDFETLRNDVTERITNIEHDVNDLRARIDEIAGNVQR